MRQETDADGSERIDIPKTGVRQSVALGISVLALFALGSCAPMQVKDQWRDANYTPASPQRVLVIGVMSNPERRRVLEDSLVSRLQTLGVTATPSYGKLTVIGPEDLDAVRRVVQQTDSNLVLSVRLVQTTQETHSTGGYYGTPPGNYAGGEFYGPGGFYRYYPYAWQGSYNPPDTHTHQSYGTETRLFDMRSNKLVWAVTIETGEPSDFKKAASQYADLVMKQLQDNKLIVGR
jgi:hypothetical protein